MQKLEAGKLYEETFAEFYAIQFQFPNRNANR